MKVGARIKGAMLCTIIPIKGNSGEMMTRALARGAMDGKMNKGKSRHFARFAFRALHMTRKARKAPGSNNS